SRARRSAVARPMPADAPVMATTRIHSAYSQRLSTGAVSTTNQSWRHTRRSTQSTQRSQKISVGPDALRASRRLRSTLAGPASVGTGHWQPAVSYCVMDPAIRLLRDLVAVNSVNPTLV